MNELIIHFNNHINRKSFNNMTSGEKKKAQPSHTVVAILEGNTLRFGLSTCSVADNFSKSIGRTRALNDAENGKRLVIPEYIINNGSIGKYFVTKAQRIIKK